MKLIETISTFFKSIYNYLLGYITIRDDCYISHKSLTRLLRTKFPNAQYIYVTDTKPNLIYREDMKKVLFMNIGIFKKWRKESYDCDDKADVLKGIMSWFYGSFAFGICRVATINGEHMLNCFIDEFSEFNFVEPQTNQIFRYKEMPYTVLHVII